MGWGSVEWLLRVAGFPWVMKVFWSSAAVTAVQPCAYTEITKGCLPWYADDVSIFKKGTREGEGIPYVKDSHMCPVNFF